MGYILVGSKVILGRGNILGDRTRVILNLGWGRTHVCVVGMLVRWREVLSGNVWGGSYVVGWSHVCAVVMLVNGVGGTCSLVRWDGGGCIYHLIKFFLHFFEFSSQFLFRTFTFIVFDRGAGRGFWVRVVWVRDFWVTGLWVTGLRVRGGLCLNNL